MMLFPSNHRFGLLIVCASAVVLGTIAAIVIIERSDGGDHAGSQVRILGFSGILLTQLVILIKTENHERKAARSRHAVRNDLHAVQATAEVARLAVAEKASQLAAKVDNIERQTNGELDARIQRAVVAAMQPVLRELAEVRQLCLERPAGK